MKNTLAALLLFACAGTTAPKVNMSGSWPEQAGAYRATHREWTRHQRVRHGVDTVLEAYATLKSSQWRAAYVAKRTKRANLSDTEAATLDSEQRADGDKAWEIVLVVATHQHRSNDFQKRDRSIWSVRLVGSEGRWVAPESIREDRRPAEVLRIWYPDAEEFYKTYVLSFPKKTADGRLLASPGEALALRIGGALGNVELAWSQE